MEKGLVFGLNIGDLLEIYDHDLQSWKMSGCLFTGDFAKCSGALPKSGIMRNGRIYEQATWVRRTGGKESGLWPTPMIPGNGGTNGKAKLKRMLWPTPQSRDYKGKSQRGADPENRDCLPNAVMNYPTPRTRGLCGGSGHKQMLVDKFGEEEGREIFNGGQLNPQFVEWLMGYPLNYTDTRDGLRLSLTREWTDLKDSEMQLSLR